MSELKQVADSRLLIGAAIESADGALHEVMRLLILGDVFAGVRGGIGRIVGVDLERKFVKVKLSIDDPHDDPDGYYEDERHVSVFNLEWFGSSQDAD